MVGTGRVRLGLFLLVLALFSTPVSAEDQIIINSQDWRDVYSGMQYGNLVGIPSNFLVSTKHSTILLYAIPTTREEVLVLSSRDRPFIVGYEGILQSRGYQEPNELRSANTNLELLKRLEGINRFIVLDDAYGYNAISVAPFAAVDRSFVIFANENNIDEIVSELEDKNPESVLIYGQVDRGVKTALEQFSPETINLGSRFENNVEIVRRYLEINPTKQTILTNGEFIEASLMSGADPILFLGRENVPEVIRNFINEEDIEVGILIGNELVNAATFVRRQLGISVFVKFAQGARQPTGSIATVEDLDRFPMPRYELAIDVTSIVYNKATGSLEVTYQNPIGLAEFFKSTITVRDDDAVWVLGDETPLFLDKNEYKTIVYRADTDGNPLNFQSDQLSGDVFVIFGESDKSLENTFQKQFEIDIIDVLDDSEIVIKDLYYDKLGNRFIVTVENIGKVAAYTSVELIDLAVNGERITVGGDGVEKVESGKKAKMPVEVEMEDEDFEDNQDILVRAYYGERELSRIKITEERFPLAFKTGYTQFALYGIILLLILLLLFWLGTKKKCKHCGYKNARGRKTCVHCGKSFNAPRHHAHPPHHR